MVHQGPHHFPHQRIVQCLLEGPALLLQGLGAGGAAGYRCRRRQGTAFPGGFLPGAGSRGIRLSIPAVRGFLDLVPDHFIHRSQRRLFQSLGSLEHRSGHARRLSGLFFLRPLLEDLPVIPFQVGDLHQLPVPFFIFVHVEHQGVAPHGRVVHLDVHQSILGVPGPGLDVLHLQSGPVHRQHLVRVDLPVGIGPVPGKHPVVDQFLQMPGDFVLFPFRVAIFHIVLPLGGEDGVIALFHHPGQVRVVLEGDDVVFVHRFPDQLHRILGGAGIVQEIPSGNSPHKDCQGRSQGDLFPFFLFQPFLLLFCFPGIRRKVPVRLLFCHGIAAPFWSVP